MTASRALGVAIALFCGGCSGDGPTADDPRLAGVAPTLVEEVRIAGGEERLVPIAWEDSRYSPTVAVSPSGSVAIRQRQYHAVSVYAATGERLGSVGREGEGPGEFTNLSGVGWLGDTLWAAGMGERRVSVFTPELEFERSIPIPTSLRPPPETEDQEPPFFLPQLSVQALLSGDTLYGFGLPGVGGAEVPDSIRGRTLFVRFLEDGRITRTVGRALLGEMWYEAFPGYRQLVPFPNQTAQGVSARADRTAFARASVEGDSVGTFALTVLDAEGETVFSRRFPFDAVPIPRGVRDSVFDHRERRFQSALSRLQPDVVPRFDPPMASVWPPLEHVVVGRQGRIWVEMREREDAGVRPYVVIEADGDEAARLRFPSNMKVVEADGDRIWVIERDRLDIESVVRYRVGWSDR